MFIQLSDLQSITSVIQSIATTLAIIIGGIWTYRIYIQKREGIPKAKLEHKINNRIVNEKIMLLDTNITIHNIGDGQMSLQSWEIILSQVIPPISHFQKIIDAFDISYSKGKRILRWHELISEIEKVDSEGKFILEPNESHQFHRNYIISSEIKTISLYTYFHNTKIKDRNIGWELNTIYDLYNKTYIQKEDANNHESNKEV